MSVNMILLKSRQIGKSNIMANQFAMYAYQSYILRILKRKEKIKKILNGRLD